MRRRASLAVLGAALAACARPPASSAPVPVSMTPSQGTGSAPLAVEIAGQHFDAVSRTDFATGKSTLDATFAAVLDPGGGAAPVALGSVALTSSHALQAVVPAGVPRGAYDLVVTDPAGRSGRLAGAFRVVTSAENVAGFRVDLVEPAYAGVPFLVSFTAVDPQGLTVDGFTGTVALADATGTATPATTSAFQLGRLQERVTVTAVAAGDVLTATALGKSGGSDPFAVSPGPPAAIAFAGASLSVPAGACSPAVVLELRDAYGNAAPAPAAVAVDLQASPAGAVAFFSDAGCAAAASSATVAAGAAQAAFRFTGAAPGGVTLRAVPAGLPSATQAQLITP